jgi:hypothetical protein
VLQSVPDLKDYLAARYPEKAAASQASTDITINNDEEFPDDADDEGTS